MVYTVLLGKLKHNSLGGYRYLMRIDDEDYDLSFRRFLKSKEEAANELKQCFRD